MARPPSRYKSERRGGCGASWRDALTVRGTIPGTGGFGESFARTLPPVVSDLEGGAGYLGWDGEYEHERKAQLETVLAGVREDVTGLLRELPEKTKSTLLQLLAGARDQLDAIEEIHESWRLRDDGTFGLQYGDAMEDFPAAQHIEDCTTYPTQGPHYGKRVPGRGRGDDVICPTRAELDQRSVDRDQVATLYRDTARWIRCAEWTLWRTILYRRALEQWDPPPSRDTPQGPRVTPPPKRDTGVRTTPGTGVRTTPDPPDLPPDVSTDGEGLGSGPIAPTDLSAAQARSKALILAGAGTLILTGVVVLATR